MYNKKVLIDSLKKLGSAKAPAQKKDMIIDPRGQWAHRGQNTRIPSNNITMDNVPYPVYADPNVGPSRMMYPEQEYTFPGADYVDEYPKMPPRIPKRQLGGLTRFMGTAGRMMSLPPAITSISNIAPKISTLSKVIPKPTLDQGTLDLLRYPVFDVLTGETKLGSPIELTKYLGDFDFKPFSDGWQARNAMMNMTAGSQKMLESNDFFTESDLIKLVNQQNEWQKARNAFDEMNPEEPGMTFFNALLGNSRREELFSNLFPNASLPNFRTKFILPEHETMLQKNLPWQYSIRNTGMLSKGSLNNIANPFGNQINKEVPSEARNLKEIQNEEGYLYTADPKMVVMEMRGGLGLSFEDVNNASPEQIEKWRQQIIENIKARDLERYKALLGNPFTGSQAYNEFFSREGSRNQYGGLVKSKNGGTALTVKQSKIPGANKGLFSNQGFKKNQLIGLAHENDQPVGEIGHMHNHAEEPNMYSVKVGNKRYVYAKRDIQPGEELTTNYRMQPELEQPEDFMRKGGSAPKLPKKKNSRAYSRSLEATNRLFAEHPLFAKPKSRKNKIYDPNAKYYQNGGLATAADSSMVAGNARRLMDFYKGSGNYYGNAFDPNPNLYGPAIWTNIQGEIKRLNTPSGKKDKSNIRINDPNNIHDDITVPTHKYWSLPGPDPNKVYARETANAILNIKAPMSLYDRRISPQYNVNLAAIKGDLKGDQVSLYMYDPLAITPAAKLTDAEIIKRYKKFGASGIPESRLIRLGLIKKPDSSTTKATKQSPVSLSFIPPVITDLEFEPPIEPETQWTNPNPEMDVEQRPQEPKTYIPEFKREYRHDPRNFSNLWGLKPRYGHWVDVPVEADGGINSPVQLIPYHSFDQPQSPEAWEADIKNLERQLGNPVQWTMDDYTLMQNKLNEYKAWREQHPEVKDTSNKPNEYVVPIPYHLRNKQKGGVPYNYNPFISTEPEGVEIPMPFTPQRTANDPEDYDQFLKYSETAPENRRPDENYFYGNPDDYDHYGMWDALGKPRDFQQALEMNPDWEPDPYDKMYHGFSVNPNTGVFLKSGKPGQSKPGDTTWMEIAGHYQGRDAQKYTPVFDPELQRFKYIPNEVDPSYIETELTPEEIEQYAKGGYIIEDISIPQLNKAQAGRIVKPVISLLNAPGVKPFLRSNINPFSYPIKAAGARIARFSAAPSRSSEDLKKIFSPKYTAMYFGDSGNTEKYGFGKRDLIANYFYGDDRGFTPTNYNLDLDPGLRDIITKYGNLNTYLLNSAIPHGQPMSIEEMQGYRKPNVQGNFGFLGDQNFQPFHLFDLKRSSDFDQWKEIFLSQNPDFQKLEQEKYDDYGTKNTEELIELGIPLNYDIKLRPEFALERQYYKDSLNNLFDYHNTDMIPFDVQPKYGINLPFSFGTNPVEPQDNIAGHMAFLKRLPNDEYEMTTRDIWSFRPGDYDVKWTPVTMDNPWRRLQTELMDSFGKPFVLHQTNPIKFNKGGLPKKQLGGLVKFSEVLPTLKSYTPGNALRSAIYRGVNPANYNLFEKAANFRTELGKTSAFNETRPFRVGLSVGYNPDNLATFRLSQGLSLEDWENMPDIDKMALFKKGTVDILQNIGRRRLDAWAVGLNQPQEYGTLKQIGDNTFSMQGIEHAPEFFSERYNDLLANNLLASNKLYTGEDPLIDLSRKHYDVTQHPFVRKNVANNPMEMEILSKWKDLPRSTLDRYLGLPEKTFTAWSPTRKSEVSFLNPDPSFDYSIYDNDAYGVMGGYRWDLANTSDGMHWQSNDRWDLNPFEKRLPVYHWNKASSFYKKLNDNALSFKPLQKLEFLSLVGGRPFNIQNNFLVEPNRFRTLKQWQKGGTNKPGNGFYTFQGVDFMKSNDQWYKKINGKYMPLTVGDVAKRSSVLDAQAHKLSPYEIEQRAKRESGTTYNNLDLPKGLVSESTAVRNINSKPIDIKKDVSNSIKKAQAEGQEKIKLKVLSENEKVKDYYKEYEQSPRYREMLKQGDPEQYEDLWHARHFNLYGEPYSPFNLPNVYTSLPIKTDIFSTTKGPLVKYESHQPEDRPNTGGFSMSHTGDITVLPHGLGVKGLMPHEWSHSIDRPSNVEGYLDRLIPKRDENYMIKSKPKSFYESPYFKSFHPLDQEYYLENLNDPEINEWLEDEENFNEYVAEPTETRARLNDIRYQSKQRGIYDPFTQKVTPEIFDKILKTKFESGDKEGFDAIQQLKRVYSDEEILWMLNNISKNESEQDMDLINDQGYAKFGGAYELGDEVDEATMKKLKQLGYTFEKIK